MSMVDLINVCRLLLRRRKRVEQMPSAPQMAPEVMAPLNLAILDRPRTTRKGDVKAVSGAGESVHSHGNAITMVRGY